MSVCFVLLATCVTACVSTFPSNLHVLTNSLDDEVLKYYSNLPDKITDVALDGIRTYLLQHNETKIDLPTIDVDFNVPILGSVGKFEGTNGVFRNPSTIQREGESSMKWGATSNVSTTVGFALMDIYFPHYNATAIGITETGDARVTVGQNDIYLEVAITWLPKCTVQLTQVNLTKMVDITADITGLGVFNWLADNIVGWILSSYETSIAAAIEKVVTDELTKVINKTNGFCKFRRAPPGNLSSGAAKKIRCSQWSKSHFYCHSS